MAQVLRRLGQPAHPDLLVGMDAGDDAAVWRRPDGRALVATTDFFTPIVDDAATWGRIAAANAASDVYAMGGTPLFALNIAVWPREELPLERLSEALAGGAEVAAAGGWVVAGGHTVDGPEPMVGQAVIGEVDPDRVLTAAGGRAGDVLVLTKPIGTGIIATAVKHLAHDATEEGGALAAAYAAAVTEMTRLNGPAAAVADEVGAHAATDVTGFGLLGHLQHLAARSGVAARVDAATVPALPDVRGLLADGHVPGGTRRNLEHVRGHLDVAEEIGEDDLILLSDAQTSGGLLLAVPPDGVDTALDTLAETGHTAAAVGALVAGDAGRIRIG